MSAAANAALPVHQLASLLETTRTESGAGLVDLVDQGPVLLVFLRHAGCTFCREALADIARDRAAIEAEGTRIVLIHMGDRAAMERVVERYGVADLARICDNNQTLYAAFGLQRGSLGQLAGIKVWWRSLRTSLRHGFSLPKADASQMPGVFWIDRGMIIRRFRHRSAADRPSYLSLARGPEQSRTK